MTILEIKSSIAAYLGVAVADLTVNGIDLGLVAMNQVRMRADMAHDFNFQKKMLTLSVSPVTGASLENAVIQGTATTVSIKEIIDMGIFDSDGRFYPIEWTTTEEGYQRQRSSGRYSLPVSPTDAQVNLSGSSCSGQRIQLRGDTVVLYPLATTGAAFTLGIEAAVFSNDWTAASDSVVVATADYNGTFLPQGTYNGFKLYLDLAAHNALWYHTNKWILSPLIGVGNGGLVDYYDLVSTSQDPSGTYTGHGAVVAPTGTATLSQSDTSSDIWTTKGSSFLMWASVVHLNNNFKFYVPRQEGNLPPPTQLAADALQGLIDWDVYKYEGRRRHLR